MNSEKTTDRFAKTYGHPGLSSRTLGSIRVLWPFIPICLTAGWLWHAALPLPPISTSQAGVLFVLLAATLALFTLWSSRRLTRFLKGADGEETVARILSFLSASHTVFNDLQIERGGPSFDHIVVSPAGIFVIETKNWSGAITFQNGQVLCNGRIPSRPPLKQVREAASALSDYLSTTGCPSAPVYPVLCFVGNRPQDGAVNVGGVRICTETELSALFKNTLEKPLPAGALGMITTELARHSEDKIGVL